MTSDVYGIPPGTRRASADEGNYDVDVYLDGVRVLDVRSFDIDRRIVVEYVAKSREGCLTIFVSGPDGKALQRTRRGRVMVVDNVTGRVEI